MTKAKIGTSLREENKKSKSVLKATSKYQLTFYLLLAFCPNIGK